jgi:ubiquinol-cytochrome c reductase cytochrome c subunit
MNSQWSRTAPLLLLLLVAGAAAQPPATEPVDEEEREYQRAVAQRAVQENCLICHSQELIETQRLTPAQWKAAVEKMVGWGAPLPADQHELVIGYLAERYTDRTDPVPPPRMTYAEAAALSKPDPALERPGGDPTRGAKLYVTHCANCHGPEAVGVDLGPNLVEKPVLLRRAEFETVVRKGQRRMPGFQTVLDAQGEGDILSWLRSRRNPIARAK